MRHFLKDLLEPPSYLVYVLAIAISLYVNNTPMRKVLLGYYGAAAILIYAATYKTDVELNRILYNVFFILTITVLYCYFRKVLVNRKAKLLANGVFVINVGFFVLDIFLSKKSADINNYFYATIYLSIVIYVLLYFGQLLKGVTELNILMQFDFYLASGYLLYFLSCFFIILLYERVEVNQRALLWSIQNIILFLASIITLGGSLWIYKQNK